LKLKEFLPYIPHRNEGHPTSMTHSRDCAKQPLFKDKKPSALQKAMKLAGQRAEAIKEAMCQEKSIVVPRG
jgi:hypothetical protein